MVIDLCLAAVAVLIIVLIYLLNSPARGQTQVRSPYDGELYTVQNGLSGSKRAAEYVSILHAGAIELMRHLRAKYILNDKFGMQYPGRVQFTKNLLERYNPDNVFENSPHNSNGDTSYTINKGAKLALCLRSKSEGSNLHHINILMFVKFHELTHIGSDVKDHPPEFWSAFKFVLQEAVECRTYTPVNYSLRPEEYCGMSVSYNPLFDANLPALI